MPIVTARKALFEIFGSSRPTLPIDLSLVAHRFGITIKPTTNSYSGSAYIENGQKIVEYNFFEPVVRSRFTIAHEIGHMLLGHTANGQKFRDTNRLGGSGDIELERQANAFAAELLVPEALITELVMHFRTDSVSDLAKMFNVSSDVIGYRLSDLGLISNRPTPNYLYG